METPLRIEALTPARLADLLAFFEQRAFVDHPEWLSCYCHFPHADHAVVKWQTRTGEQNRAATSERVRAGTMHGLLAYDGERVAGWCNAGSRDFVRGLFDELDPPEAGVASITCFIVAPESRGRGIAGTLLEAACDRLAKEGYAWAEAYPRADAQTAAALHHGSRAMYERGGFTLLRADADGALIMRRPLNKV